MGGPGGDDRLRLRGQLGRWAGRVHTEGHKRCRSGDTIVVRGVHHEDVIIRKNGIKLRGIDGAVIETPAGAKADSLYSRVSKPTAICVLGDVNLKPGEVEITGPPVSDVSVSGFTIRGLKDKDGLRIDATTLVTLLLSETVS